MTFVSIGREFLNWEKVLVRPSTIFLSQNQCVAQKRNSSREIPQAKSQRRAVVLAEKRGGASGEVLDQGRVLGQYRDAPSSSLAQCISDLRACGRCHPPVGGLSDFENEFSPLLQQRFVETSGGSRYFSPSCKRGKSRWLA